MASLPKGNNVGKEKELAKKEFAFPFFLFHIHNL
jgi:hypothetical protein